MYFGYKYVSICTSLTVKWVPAILGTILVLVSSDLGQDPGRVRVMDFVENIAKKNFCLQNFSSLFYEF